MGAITGLMTFEEVDVLPERTDGVLYELHQGKLIQVPMPKKWHFRRRVRIRQLIEPLAKTFGIVCSPVGFRALPEYDYRRADVAFLNHAHWGREEEYIFGAPELIIIILAAASPGTVIEESRRLCLQNGCEEYWVVDEQVRTIEVAMGVEVLTYRRGEQIALTRFGQASIAVDDIFKH